MPETASPIGVAIIGSGIFVKEQHIPAILQCELLSLKAIFSRSLQSASAAAALLPGTAPAPDLYAEDAGAGKDLAALLARDDVAAVVIALPIPAQPAFVRAALAAGKHVLAEKPIAPDVDSARALLAYAASEEVRATLSIAENQRFFPRFAYALEQLVGKDVGCVTHFSVRVSGLVGEDSKYYGTAWRQTPAFQGGFLLDGGVHFAAGLRMLLEVRDAAVRHDEFYPARVSARTVQVRAHLPPADSVAALVMTRGGATGTYQHSVGSTISAYEFDVAYERGSVRICDGEVTVTVGEDVRKRTFERASGVPEEMRAWAVGIRDGRPDERLSPAEALADLEFIEKMLRSGDKDGQWLDYEFQ